MAFRVSTAEYKGNKYFDCFRRFCNVAESDCSLRHVRPSAHMEQLGSRYADFREILYWAVLLNSLEKIPIWLKSDKRNRHFTHTYDHFGYLCYFCCLVSTLTCVYVVAMGYLGTMVAQITVDLGYLGYQNYKCDSFCGHFLPC